MALDLGAARNATTAIMIIAVTSSAGAALALVAQVEEMPNQHPDDEDGNEQQPVVFVSVGHGMVGAQHNEQHRQGDVVVMHRALFAPDAG